MRAQLPILAFVAALLGAPSLAVPAANALTEPHAVSASSAAQSPPAPGGGEDGQARLILGLAVVGAALLASIGSALLLGSRERRLPEGLPGADQMATEILERRTLRQGRRRMPVDPIGSSAGIETERTVPKRHRAGQANQGPGERKLPRAR